MINDRIIWFGRYEGWLRHLAHGVKDGDADCMRSAAKLFDLMLPDDCSVVPMPSHEGRATTMLTVATLMANLSARRVVCDVLRCEPHLPSYVQKKAGMAPGEIKMCVEPPCACLGRVFVIDNCVASGATAAAALRAIPDATVCALAYSPWR